MSCPYGCAASGSPLLAPTRSLQWHPTSASDITCRPTEIGSDSEEPDDTEQRVRQKGLAGAPMGRGKSWTPDQVHVLQGYANEGRSATYVTEQHPSWSSHSVKKAACARQQGDTKLAEDQHGVHGHSSVSPRAVQTCLQLITGSGTSSSRH